jgi:hypothetical protein
MFIEEESQPQVYLQFESDQLLTYNRNNDSMLQSS